MWEPSQTTLDIGFCVHCGERVPQGALTLWKLKGTKRLQQLQKMEDTFRAEHPLWMDEEVALADIAKQWQEARANWQIQFKVGNYRDSSGESNIRLLTGTIKAD